LKKKLVAKVIEIFEKNSLKVKKKSKAFKPSKKTIFQLYLGRGRGERNCKRRLSGKSPKECVEYGAAHGALAMTTPGDTSTAILSEVEKVIKSKSARVER